MVGVRDGAVAAGDNAQVSDLGSTSAGRGSWRVGQGRWLIPAVITAAVLAWVTGAVSGHLPWGRAQLVSVVVGAVFTGVSVGLPLWQHRRANAARADAVAAATAARAAMRVALSDTLDPFVHLLGSLSTACEQRKPHLRGEAISLAVAALAALGNEHRVRVCFFALRQHPQRLCPDRFAGRSGAPTVIFTGQTPAGAAALGIAHGGTWLYFSDTDRQPPPCWCDEYREYRSVLIGPVVTPGESNTVQGLLTLDAPQAGELDRIDVAQVRLVAGLLATALSI